jgi:hypothetical protein
VKTHQQYFWCHCPQCCEASKHHLEVWLSPTSSINLGFTTEGRLATMLIIPSSWGSQWAVLTSHQPSTPMRPVETPQPGQDTAGGSSRPARAMATPTLSGAAPSPSRSDSSAAPRWEDRSVGASVGELEERALPTVMSSPQIAKGMERLTSTTSLSVPSSPPPARTSPSPSLPQPQQPRVVRRSGRHV